MFKKWRQNRENQDQLVLRYIKENQHSELFPLGNQIGVGRLYSSLVRLRRQGLIDSVEGEQIAGGACRQLYFVKEA